MDQCISTHLHAVFAVQVQLKKRGYVLDFGLTLPQTTTLPNEYISVGTRT